MKRPRQGAQLNGTVETKTADVDFERAKEEEVKISLLQNPVDTDRLRELALSPGGLATHNVRKLAWPKLLGLNRYDLKDYKSFDRRNSQTDQIGRDVERSLWHFQTGPSKRKRRGLRRHTLRETIQAMVVKHELHYYQGYHDFMSVLVLVLTEDDKLCFAVAERISLYYLRDYMRPNFDVLLPLMSLVFPLVRRFDPEVASFLDASGVHAHFALSWVITWFAHDIGDLDTAARLFDAFMASPPLFPFYLSAAVVRYRREELLELECDFATVHKFLSDLPQDLPFDDLIITAAEMLDDIPPHQLVQEHPESGLPSLLKEGAVVTLQQPPGWYEHEAEPDWLLVEKQRRVGGRNVACRTTRRRRQRAAKAGAHIPRAGEDGEHSDDGERRREGEARGASSRKGARSGALSATFLGLAVSVGAVALTAYCLGGRGLGGLGSWVHETRGLHVEGGAKDVIALTREVTQH